MTLLKGAGGRFPQAASPYVYHNPLPISRRQIHNASSGENKYIGYSKQAGM